MSKSPKCYDLNACNLNGINQLKSLVDVKTDHRIKFHRMIEETTASIAFLSKSVQIKKKKKEIRRQKRKKK